MPLCMQLPRGSMHISIGSKGCFVGRKEMTLCRCPGALFVSRQQCKLDLQGSGKQVKLTHIAANNHTLVILADKETMVLKQGDCVALSAGDSFSLIADNPSEAIQLIWKDGQQQQAPPEQQQQSEALTEQQQQRQHHDVEQLKQPAADQAQLQQKDPAIADDTASSKRPWQQQLQQPSSAVPPSGVTSPTSFKVAAATATVQQQEDGGADTAQTQQPPPSTAAAAAAAVQAHSVMMPTPAVAASNKPIMLLLVGLPGSGKSTFSQSLMSQSRHNWVRVNQDSIGSGGKRGTREQCIRAAVRQLQAGNNVIIDRCNIDAAQRAHFVETAGQCCAAVHTLLLDLPAQLCAARAAQREDHEGGVQGKGAARVVYQMNSQYNKAGPPSATEGFASMMVCKTPQQVAAALRHWAAAAVGAMKQESGVGHQQDVSAATDVAMEAGPPPKRARRVSSSPKPGIGPCTGSTTMQVATSPSKQQQQQQRQGPVTSASASTNAFQLLMQGAKQQQQKPTTALHGKSPKTGSASTAAQTTAAALGSEAVASSPSAAASHTAVGRAGGSWSSALTAIAAAPDRFMSSACVWHVDNQVVGILDKFPKAKHHALLLARQQDLQKVTDLRGPQHVELLRHMKQVALTWTTSQQQYKSKQQQQQGDEQQQRQGVPAGWKLGFHSVPSMDQLHLHIISTDFDSDCLKTKKHWNSFTGSFFLDLDDVIQQLESKAGQVMVDGAAAEALLKAPLVCHVCSKQLKNMPELKQHIKEHNQVAR